MARSTSTPCNFGAAVDTDSPPILLLRCGITDLLQSSACLYLGETRFHLPPFVPSRAYKRARECLDFLIENGEGRSSALTMRLPSSGVSSAAPYHFDLIGGKEGTRTLDPGIMSAALAHECGQGCVASSSAIMSISRQAPNGNCATLTA